MSWSIRFATYPGSLWIPPEVNREKPTTVTPLGDNGNMSTETHPQQPGTEDTRPGVSREALVAADAADAPDIAEALADELEAELENTNRETSEESL